MSTDTSFVLNNLDGNAHRSLTNPPDGAGPDRADPRPFHAGHSIPRRWFADSANRERHRQAILATPRARALTTATPCDPLAYRDHRGLFRLGHHVNRGWFDDPVNFLPHRKRTSAAMVTFHKTRTREHKRAM